MANAPHQTIWLTSAAHGRLQAEFDELTRLNPTPSPQVEGRIRELRALLNRAEVGDKPDDGLVEHGMTVTVVFDNDPNPSTFLLALRGVVDSAEIDMDVYPPTSPLGTAILGKYPGDTFSYFTPTGAEVCGQIVRAEPFRNVEEVPRGRE